MDPCSLAVSPIYYETESYLEILPKKNLQKNGTGLSNYSWSCTFDSLGTCIHNAYMHPEVYSWTHMHTQYMHTHINAIIVSPVPETSVQLILFEKNLDLYDIHEFRKRSVSKYGKRCRENGM